MTTATAVPSADNNIIYTESAERQLPTEQTRTNCETTESLTENRMSSSPSSDRLQMNLSNPYEKYATIGAHHTSYRTCKMRKIF